MAYRVFLLSIAWFLFATVTLKAQQSAIRQLQLAETDTARVRILCDASFEYLNTEVDSSMYFAQEALRISMGMDNGDCQSRSLNAIGNALLQTGQHDKAFETYLSALRIAEKVKAMPRIAQTYANIGNMYINQGEYRLSMEYLFRAKPINDKNGDYDKLTINLVNIGVCYQYMDIPDSALHYFTLAYDLIRLQQITDYECSILYYIGTVYTDMKKPDIAARYFHLGLAKAKETQNQTIMSSCLQGLGHLMKAIHPDSALYYAQKSFEIAASNKYTAMSMNASKALYELYLAKGEKDSSLKYLKLRYDLQDSLFNYEKRRHVQMLTVQEQLREEEIRVMNARLEKERMQNVQYVGIASFIFSLFVLVIILSRRSVKPRVVEFVGLIALLLFFEFIALLLHPFIVRLAHHKPIFELMLLVGIALILIPAHHRLEQFVKEKVVRKQTHGKS